MPHRFSTYSDVELSEFLRREPELHAEIFQEVYDRYAQRVYSYSLRILAHREDAGDILQETFIRLYNVMCQTPVQNIGAYALRTARNLCLNHIRDRRKHDVLGEDIHGDSLVQAFEQKDLLSLISKALPRLDLELREAFVLRYYQNLEYTEMAEIMGESLNTVRNRVWRSKERLKVLLAPYIEELHTIMRDEK